MINREFLLTEMSNLRAKGINCASCVGECCTSKRNSMQITREEAQDIVDDLRARGVLSEDLVARVRACIREYRLDVEIPSFGSRPNLRRTYTCPLYRGGAKGCMVSFGSKPLGCLAFNPNRAGAIGMDSGCSSRQDLLREASSKESQKLPIPVALLSLI